MSNIPNNNRLKLSLAIAAPIIGIGWISLILFNIATPWKTYKLEVRIPKKLSYDIFTIDSNPDLILIKINKNRQVYLNGKLITLDNLQKRLKEILVKQTEDRRILYIRASKELPYNFVVTITDLAKGSGATYIGLQIDYLE